MPERGCQSGTAKEGHTEAKYSEYYFFFHGHQRLEQIHKAYRQFGDTEIVMLVVFRYLLSASGATECVVPGMNPARTDLCFKIPSLSKDPRIAVT